VPVPLNSSWTYFVDVSVTVGSVTRSLHDALPILQVGAGATAGTLGTATTSLASGTTLIFNRSNALTHAGVISGAGAVTKLGTGTDRKSTRLNSSHGSSSYAVFRL